MLSLAPLRNRLLLIGRVSTLRTDRRIEEEAVIERAEGRLTVSHRVTEEVRAANRVRLSPYIDHVLDGVGNAAGPNRTRDLWAWQRDSTDASIFVVAALGGERCLAARATGQDKTAPRPEYAS